MKEISSLEKLHAAFETFLGDEKIEDGWPAALVRINRALERIFDFSGLRYAFAVTSGSLRQFCEVEIQRELRSDIALAECLGLDIPDRTERAVIQDAPGHTELELGRHRQDVHHHLKRAVANQTDRRPVWVNQPRHRKRRCRKTHTVKARWYDGGARLVDLEIWKSSAHALREHTDIDGHRGMTRKSVANFADHPDRMKPPRVRGHHLADLGFQRSSLPCQVVGTRVRICIVPPAGNAGLIQLGQQI